MESKKFLLKLKRVLINFNLHLINKVEMKKKTARHSHLNIFQLSSHSLSSHSVVTSEKTESGKPEVESGKTGLANIKCGIQVRVEVDNLKVNPLKVNSVKIDLVELDRVQINRGETD